MRILRIKILRERFKFLVVTFDKNGLSKNLLRFFFKFTSKKFFCLKLITQHEPLIVNFENGNKFLICQWVGCKILNVH